MGMKVGDQVARIKNNEILAYGFVARVVGPQAVCRFWGNPDRANISGEVICSPSELKRYDLYMHGAIIKALKALGYKVS